MDEASKWASCTDAEAPRSEFRVQGATCSWDEAKCVSKPRAFGTTPIGTELVFATQREMSAPKQNDMSVVTAAILKVRHEMMNPKTHLRPECARYDSRCVTFHICKTWKHARQHITPATWVNDPCILMRELKVYSFVRTSVMPCLERANTSAKALCVHRKRAWIWARSSSTLFCTSHKASDCGGTSGEVDGRRFGNVTSLLERVAHKLEHSGPQGNSELCTES